MGVDDRAVSAHPRRHPVRGSPRLPRDELVVRPAITRGTERAGFFHRPPSLPKGVRRFDLVRLIIHSFVFAAGTRDHAGHFDTSNEFSGLLVQVDIPYWSGATTHTCSGSNRTVVRLRADARSCVERPLDRGI